MTDNLDPGTATLLSLQQLQNKVDLLEAQLQTQTAELEMVKGRIPDSNIISPSFLKRAFTVFGHYIVAGFIVAIPFICLSMGFVMLTAIFSE